MFAFEKQVCCRRFSNLPEARAEACGYEALVRERCNRHEQAYHVPQVAAHYVASAHRWAIFIIWPLMKEAGVATYTITQVQCRECNLAPLPPTVLIDCEKQNMHKSHHAHLAVCDHKHSRKTVLAFCRSHLPPPPPLVMSVVVLVYS